MKDIINSVYLKHDSRFTSLTKKALAQIVLKLVYKGQTHGVFTNSIRNELKALTNINLSNQDIDASINELEREGKIRTKNNRHFIKDSYIETIQNAISESEKLHKQIIDFWFIKSDTGKSESGEQILTDWLQDTLIEFFKAYKYQWIKELQSKKSNSSKSELGIKDIVDKTLIKYSKIEANDYDRLFERFVGFLESERIEDNNLIWIYASSVFSAALITARNYADEFTMEIFRDSTFILDTNILMIIHLEGSKFHQSLIQLEKTFKNLNINPVYFYITKAEYFRAFEPKKESILKGFDQFGLDVIKQSDCDYIKTAIYRRCETRSQFEKLLDDLDEIPKIVKNEIKIEARDYLELSEVIESGSNNERTLSGINHLYKNKTGREKREAPLRHDAGLIAGAEFLRKKGKCWILTRDRILREYGDQISVRDELPIALGIDSFIQMLAIETGGTDLASTNYAPLFSRIIRSSLVHKEVFQPEDLDLIIETRIAVEELTNDQIVSIAKKVNRMRAQNESNDNISLAIDRNYRKARSFNKLDIENLKEKNLGLALETERQAVRSNSYKGELFNDKYQLKYQKLKRKVNYNRMRLAAACILIILTLSTLYYFRNNATASIGIGISVLIEILCSFLWMKIPKLMITEMDVFALKKEVKEEIDNLSV